MFVGTEAPLFSSIHLERSCFLRRNSISPIESYIDKIENILRNEEENSRSPSEPAPSANMILITYEGHPARSSQRFTSPGARDGGPTLAERVARRHGRRLDRVSGQCASSNMSFVRNQEHDWRHTMSEQARVEFDEARVQQTTKNDARRIRQRVVAALQGPARAGVRWPFELMQNAHDAGPRDGDGRVEIVFALKADRLVVSHTGKPFVAQELAALLSGGSSKEFDSDETTGRFGTGFLVTHALSTQVDVKGVLSTRNGARVFPIRTHT